MQASYATGDPPEEKSLEFSRVRLAFLDKDVEKRFDIEQLDQSLPMTRLYMVLGTFMYIAFGLLDYLVLGDDFWHIFLLRIFICPAILVLVAITYLPNRYSYIQGTLSLSLLLSGGGIIYMTTLIEAPFNHLYYAGLILMMIFSANLIVYKFAYASIVSTVLYISYIATATMATDLPTWALLNNVFFLTCTLAWNIWSAYWSEFFIRNDFASRQRLIVEKQKSDALAEAAQAGNRAKSEFLAVMSHELRTPLNAIIGFSEIIQQELFGPIGSDKYKSYVDDIADSGRHLLSVINDILDLSKAEAGKLELNEDEVDVCETIDNTLRMFRQQAADRGVRINLNAPGDCPQLWVDARLFRQMLINLVSNAVKFTQQGGSVEVGINLPQSGGCEFYVQDTGIGIAAEDIEKVVQPFVQVESALSRENGGTGLGLPLVKKIAEMHGGDIRIESVPGSGTTVTAFIPKDRVIEPAPRREPANEDLRTA